VSAAVSDDPELRDSDLLPIGPDETPYRLLTTEGVSTRLAQHCIRSVEVLEYPELGMEAVWRIDVADFPAFIVVDDKGNDFYTDPSGAVPLPLSDTRLRSAE
jgi:hypothetical protein